VYSIYDIIALTSYQGIFLLKQVCCCTDQQGLRAASITSVTQDWKLEGRAYLDQICIPARQTTADHLYEMYSSSLCFGKYAENFNTNGSVGYGLLQERKRSVPGQCSRS
jgi:hypothetical protein